MKINWNFIICIILASALGILVAQLQAAQQQTYVCPTVKDINIQTEVAECPTVIMPACRHCPETDCIAEVKAFKAEYEEMKEVFK